MRRTKQNALSWGLSTAARSGIIRSEAVMRIGIVTAMVEETVPIITKLGGVVAEDNIAGVRIVQIEAGGHTGSIEKLRHWQDLAATPGRALRHPFCL